VFDWLPILVAAAAFLALALGLAYWAYTAQADRSALVGLYLLFGIPAALLTAAAIVVYTRGDTTLAPLLLSVGLGLGLPLLRPFRSLLARVTPLDPASAIDMAGLCLVFGFLGLFPLLSVVQFQGEPPSAEAIGSVGVAEIVIQNVALLLLAYVAVGVRIWRSWPEATERLGIVRPDLRTIGIALAATLVALLVAAAFGLLAQQLDPTLGGSLDEVVSQMTEQFQNPLGALILGASAGIGEEAVFRGALQPRYGIVIPSLLFMVLHGPQYGLNVLLLSLFAVSIILGLERKYVNTTAAMITHALFNALQVLALSTMS
jgi:membrane protease YdiL (CAAX protease family)